MIGQSAGKSWSYLVGVFLGDGCVSIWSDKNRPNTKRKVMFRLNSIDVDFIEATKSALKEHTSVTVTTGSHTVSKSSKPNNYLACGDEHIAAKLEMETDCKRQIPSWVFGASKEEKLAFIAGLMDSEGFVAAKTGKPTSRSYYMGFKSTDVWFDDFIRVLNSVGIKIGKIGVEKPRRPGYRVPKRFSIKMQSWVDSGAYFNIARKQNRVDEWVSTEPYSQRSVNPRRVQLTSETTRQAEAA